MQAAIDKLGEWQKQGATPTTAGSMYQVNIGADPEHFLDWDKPLSEQSQHVQDALSPDRLGLTVKGPFGEKGYYGYTDENGKLVGSAQTGGPPNTVFNPKELGMSIYRGAGSWSDPVATAQRLQAAGIPGIRYLDQGSPSAGPRHAQLRRVRCQHDRHPAQVWHRRPDRRRWRRSRRNAATAAQPVISLSFAPRAR